MAGSVDCTPRRHCGADMARASCWPARRSGHGARDPSAAPLPAATKRSAKPGARGNRTWPKLLEKHALED
jgi:hypothetical protein